MTERITQTWIGREFGWDTLEDVNWGILRNNVLCARNILTNPEKFPKANFDYLETMDLEGTCFLLKAPIQYLV